MKKFIGINVIQAEPQIQGHFYGFNAPNDGIGEGSFYKDGYRIKNKNGQDLWMSKTDFEKEYMPISNDNFNSALNVLNEVFKNT